MPTSSLFNADQYMTLADQQVGKPYVLGADGPAAFDCSGLVIWLNNQSGAFVMGDDTAAGIYNRTKAVTGEPKVGDLVFLRLLLKALEVDDELGQASFLFPGGQRGLVLKILGALEVDRG